MTEEYQPTNAEEVQSKIRRALDPALSTEDYGNLPLAQENVSSEEQQNWEKHLRLMGTMLKDASLDFLDQQYQDGNISMHEVLNSLHIVTSGGWRFFDYDEDVNYKESIDSGEFRSWNVAFGEFVPPDHHDVPELTSQLADKLDTLLKQATASDIDVLGSWAYSTFVAIHPRADVNGRNGRALVDFIQHHIKKSRQLESPQQNFPSSKEEGYETAALALNSVLSGLALFPEKQGDDGFVSSMNAWEVARKERRENEYFDDVSSRIQSHIASINTVEDLHQIPQLIELSKSLKSKELLKKGETRSLIAESGKTVFKEALKKRIVKRIT